jgi:NhaP-type Na+/H+ or K+/H+ antiporter
MIQSFLFLLVGVNIDSIYTSISAVPLMELSKFLVVVLVGVVVGRFLWVFPATYLPKFLFSSKRKKEYPSWQSTFVISWAGMRGAISLAAALAVPAVPVYIENINANDLVTFLVFGVIFSIYTDESHARRVVERLVRLYQSAILYQKSPSWLAEVFFKQNNEPTQLLGTLMDTGTVDLLLKRAWPT